MRVNSQCTYDIPMYQGEYVDNLNCRMVECFEYYKVKMRKWLEDRNANSARASNAIIAALITKLRVVAIYLDFNEKEYLIFETLNARGEPLTEWEKSKNYLMYMAEKNLMSLFTVQLAMDFA